MSATGYIEQVCASSGIDRAYALACTTLREQAARLDELWTSRFFERRILDDGSKKLWPTTEKRISRAYDEKDLDGEAIPDFFYCDTDGELYAVTVGEQTRHEPDPEGPDETPFHYASAAMIANGKVVGHVRYTDH